MRVADYLMRAVHRLGVDHVFMVAAGGAMYLDDAIRESSLTPICCHHEQAAAMAASAYARYRGLGCCCVTTGCGGTNTLTGLLGAWQDSVPVIFISGDTNETSHGTGMRQFGVQEFDILSVVEHMTKYVVRVETDSVHQQFAEAVRLATTGRPGPVWLDVPMDVAASPDPVEWAIGFLTGAERPLVIAGGGIRAAGAIAAFEGFITKYDVPFVASMQGADLLPHDHPLFCGTIGIRGSKSGNEAVWDADRILVLGSRLSVATTGYDHAEFTKGRIVVVDIDSAEHQKATVPIERVIVCDVKQFLEEAV